MVWLRLDSPSPTRMTSDIFDDTMSSLPELLGFSKVIQKAYEAVSGSAHILAEKLLNSHSSENSPTKMILVKSFIMQISFGRYFLSITDRNCGAVSLHSGIRKQIFINLTTLDYIICFFLWKPFVINFCSQLFSLQFPIIRAWQALTVLYIII